MQNYCRILLHSFLFICLFFAASVYANIHFDSPQVSTPEKWDFKKSQIYFSAIDTNNVLPHPTVTDIEQDEYGFVWFGTHDGLAKWDGRNAKIYKLSGSNGDVESNWIRDIHVDLEGRLWVASNSGFSLYIPETDSFQTFYKDKESQTTDSEKYVAVAESPNGQMWFASPGSVTNFDVNSNQFSTYHFDSKKIIKKGKVAISDIEFDSEGNLWVSTYDDGIGILKPGKQIIEDVNLDRLALENIPGLQTLLYDKDNNSMWVGTESIGAIELKLGKNDFNIYSKNSIGSSICSNFIFDIIKDHLGNVWFATEEGICKFSNSKFITYSKTTAQNSSLLSNRVLSIFQDEGGVIWLGTLDGVNYWNAAFPAFDHISDNSDAKISNNNVLSFAEDSKENFYVGTWGGGINVFSPQADVVRNITPSQENSLDNDAIASLLVDSNDNLWVGTFKAGLFLRQKGKERFSTFKFNNEFKVSDAPTFGSKTVSSNSIPRIIELKDGRIAIATYGGGLNLYENGEFKYILATTKHQNRISSNLIIDVVEDNEGNLWLGTAGGGLNRYNLETGKVDVFMSDSKKPNSLRSNDVYGVLNTQNYIWMATNNKGVARLDKQALKKGEVKFEHFGTHEGLASDFTYGVLEDDRGFIWISHSKGLSRLNPITLRSINFNTSHGLQGTDFHSGAFFKASNGRMFFGGSNGFNTFMPENVPINTYKPPIRLTKFSQSNEETPIHELFSSNGYLELKYNQTVIDFEFAALDYTKPELNKYKYKIEGLGNVWRDLGTSNHISFSYLEDGFYTLKVKGSNNDDVWSDELSIPIRVLPPLWRTWYAYLFYFLAGSALFLALVRHQQIKLQTQLNNERKLHKLAYFDSLTGLPNRQSFYESMERFLSLAKRGNYNAGVMFIDLDRFKRINDTLGHNFGDKVLMEVAERLRLSVRNSDFVGRNYEVKSFKNEIARLGGDEFTVFLSHLDSPEETTNVTQRIIDSISKPIMVDGYEVTVTPSIGIAMYPENGSTVQELMKHADVAMYQAKEGGRRTFKYYSNSLNDKAMERLKLEEYLRAAVKNQEFELYYQPQVDLITNEVTKAEALLRWIHPELGFVSPADFIPIAEESGIIIELGDWILQQACLQAKEWYDKGHNIRVSVNVSSVQFKQTNLVDNIKNALDLSELPRELLELELTESAVMSDVEDNIGRLQLIKDMGIKIAVDDFGTGYSSLSYLKKFPIDTLKIDRSFIIDVDSNENDAAIVKAIMLLAETMQLNVVAEGVETLEQLRLIDNYGCQYVQGYFFSRPLPFDDFVTFINEEFVDKQTWKLDLIG